MPIPRVTQVRTAFAAAEPTGAAITAQVGQSPLQVMQDFARLTNLVLKDGATAQPAPTPVVDPLPTAPLKLAANGLISSKPAALYLKDLTLNKSFDFALFGEAENEVHVVAVCWDLSGKPPRVFPPLDGTAPPSFIPMEAHQKIEFVGDGLQLWPDEPVVGGLFVRLMVLDSDEDERRLGDTLASIHKTVAESPLTGALTPLLAGAVNPLVMGGISTAAGVLLDGITALLRNNGDDVVDLFDGSFGAERIVGSSTKSFNQSGASVTIELFTQ